MYTSPNTILVINLINLYANQSHLSYTGNKHFSQKTNEREIDENAPLLGKEVESKTNRAVEKNIDKEILKQICLTKKAGYANIKICSTEPPQIFVGIRQLLIEYSKCLHSLHGIEASALDENDFYTGKTTHFIAEINPSHLYKIVLDDSLDFNILSDTSNTFKIHKWISSSKNKNYHLELNSILLYRKRICDTQTAVDDLSLINSWESINSKYSVDGLKGFYVYDEGFRKEIYSKIEIIKSFIKNNPKRESPICIFLAGSPGTGKSFFVEKIAEYLNAPLNYPVTSLSGVSTDKFNYAIDNHISKAFDQICSCEMLPTIAFLDEVDTKGNHLAFRLLMDAMTGSRMDDLGMKADKKCKSSESKNLVWFFAGSAGITRNDFIKIFKRDDRKISDFFDRIHVDINLPSVNDHPGQAMLAFLSYFKNILVKKDKVTIPLNVHSSVLHLIGRIDWKSTRHILSTGRILYSKKASEKQEEFSLVLSDFKDLNIMPEFKHLYDEVVKITDARTLTIS